MFAAIPAVFAAGVFDHAVRGADVEIDDRHLSQDSEAEQVEMENGLFTVTSKTIRLRPHGPTEPLSPAPPAIPPGWPADAPPPAWSAWSQYVFKEVNPAGPLKHATVSGNLFGGNIVPLMDSETAVKVKIVKMKLEEMQNADSESFALSGAIGSKRTAPPPGAGGGGRGKPVKEAEQTYDKAWNVNVKYPRFDMTVDADNNGEIGGDDHKKQNDAPSKYVPVHDTDGDHNGIPGFAQLAAPDLTLTPVRLRVNKAVNPAGGTLTFGCSSASPLLAMGDPKTVYAPAGKVRLWKAGGARTAAELIAPGTAYPAKELIEKGVFIEGVAASAAGGDIEITAEFNGTTVGGNYFKMKDKIRVTTYKVDADVDSDNDDVAMTSEYNLEDQAEAKAGETGKIILVDDADGDDDGRAGFADGFPIAGAAPEDGPAADQKFTPLRVKVSEALDLNAVRLRFVYAASDPNDMTRLGAAPDFTYRPAPGHLRVWTKDGAARRKKESAASDGDFVPMKVLLTPAQMKMQGRTATLYVEGVRGSDVAGDLPIKVEVLPMGAEAGGEHFDEVKMTALGGAIIPDWNRDGVIDDEDRYQVTVKRPWRWWINDDKDEGEVASGDSDVPVGGHNYSDGLVNGLCDLPDFFPIWIDLEQTLQILAADATLRCKIRQADSAVNMVYTRLPHGRVSDFLKEDEPNMYGEDYSDPAKKAPVVGVAANGVELSRSFIDRARYGAGVLLVEVSKASHQPLVLEVSRQGKILFERKLAINTSGVEEMYRWVNLRDVVDLDPANSKPLGSAIMGERLGSPVNRPDLLTTDKHFVFVHGYNVSEVMARAWGSEIFKRMYQSGMNAKFTMVAWAGNTSQTLGLLTPDYWENVTNAFITAEHLKVKISALPGAKVIAAHSLGNMAVCGAIKDHGMEVEKYFMLDAAVAQEAFDEAQAYTFRNIAPGVDDLLCNPTWYKFNTKRARWVFANEWHRLFPTMDGRRTLTWRNRFEGISNAINYYSTGEEVLQRSSDGHWPGPGATQAWVYQEMGKGRDDTVMGTWPGVDIQGGWGFNPKHNVAYSTGIFDLTKQTRTTEEEAQAIPHPVLRREPFFKRFQIHDLMHPVRGDLKARDPWVRAKTLAEAIPASSQPCGSSEVLIFRARNKDLMDLKNGWPAARWLSHPTDPNQRMSRWLHSDTKDVAYHYNYKLFQDWIQQGDLK